MITYVAHYCLDAPCNYYNTSQPNIVPTASQNYIQGHTIAQDTLGLNIYSVTTYQYMALLSCSHFASFLILNTTNRQTKLSVNATAIEIESFPVKIYLQNQPCFIMIRTKSCTPQPKAWV